MRHARFVLPALVALGLVGQPADAGIIWVGTTLGNIFTLDTSTASASLVGSSGVGGGLTDVAFDDSGNLWGINFTTLYSVDPTNGAATSVGALGYGGANALTYGNGSLHMAGFTNPGNLFTVNTTTGAATAVGALGFSSSGDLAFDALGTLYLTTTLNTLVSVNATTGAGTAIGALGYSDVYGLAYVDGAMWGISHNNLFQINLTTGAGGPSAPITGLGSEQVWGASAAPPVPEPATLLLLGSGLAGIAARRRRQK